jgi:NAD(P)-dependent dehydrogenase (short-subunit alcohol dehydrogenase family)
VTAFAGKTALITGGASGIGLALGTELRRLGATVVLADVDPAAEEVFDVRDLDAFCAVVERHAPVDLLFNNAGISMGGPAHELTAANWDGIIDVNLRGVVNGVLAAYPAMVERGSGHIVNVASGAGLVAPPFVTAYAATKHAVVGLSTGLRPEAALHGVRVSVICPGAVDTPILDRRDGVGAVTAREYLRVVRQKPVAADAFARRALRGVARNRAVIIEPPSARALWYLHRLSPALTRAVVARLAATIDRKLVRRPD